MMMPEDHNTAPSSSSDHQENHKSIDYCAVGSAGGDGGDYHHYHDEYYNCHSSNTTGLFERNEIILGKEIGQGMYCKVYQVKAIELVNHHHHHHHHHHNHHNNNNHESSPSPRSSTCSSNGSIHRLSNNNNNNNGSGDMVLDWTRSCMEQCTKQQGSSAKYCIKFLKPQYFRSEKFEEAAFSLDHEIQFFKSTRHPNIAELRGVSKEGCDSYYFNGRFDSYFWIMDRMVETLEGRRKRWKTQVPGKSNKQRRRGSFGSLIGSPRLLLRRGGTGGGGGKTGNNNNTNDAVDTKMKERLQVALDMASAIDYVHGQRIVLSNLTPNSFGFSSKEVNAPVQLFDASMAQRLEEEDNQGNITHNNDEEDDEDHLLPNRYYKTISSGSSSSSSCTSTSSLRDQYYKYLAPEILWGNDYGTKADVYSFLLILFELISLDDLDWTITQRCKMTRIILEDAHFLFKSPQISKLFLRGSGWSIQPKERPSMNTILTSLRMVFRQVESDCTLLFTSTTSNNNNNKKKNLSCPNVGDGDASKSTTTNDTTDNINNNNNNNSNKIGPSETSFHSSSSSVPLEFEIVPDDYIVS